MSEPTKPEIVTRVAHAGHDSQRYRGHDLFRELLPSRLSQLFILGITGRRVSEEVAELVEDALLCVAVADPRIWPMKIARLASCYGSEEAGLAAPYLALADARLGPAPFGPAARALVALAEAVGFDPDDDALDAEVERWFRAQRFPAGFGVPFRAVDERAEALASSLARLGRAHGPYVKLFRRVVDRSRERGGPEPNITLAASAALLDAGFEPAQIVSLMNVAVVASYQPNAIEEASLRSPSLRALPPAWIDDQTAPPRSTRDRRRAPDPEGQSRGR